MLVALMGEHKRFGYRRLHVLLHRNDDSTRAAAGTRLSQPGVARGLRDGKDPNASLALSTSGRMRGGSSFA